jgi:hypothetical protein
VNEGGRATAAGSTAAAAATRRRRRQRRQQQEQQRSSYRSSNGSSRATAAATTAGSRLGGRDGVRVGTMECEWARWSAGGAIECRRVPWSAGCNRCDGVRLPLPPSITFFLLINHLHCCYVFIPFFIICIRCIYSIYSFRNRGYQRYRGFRGTPRFLRVGVYPYPPRVRCTRVRVRCGKTRPAGYPCGTLSTHGSEMRPADLPKRMGNGR